MPKKHTDRIQLTTALIGTLILATVLSSCSSDDLPKLYLLGKLRVLALKASSPELTTSGGSVSITPLVTDVTGAGRTLTYTVEACNDPGVSQGVAPSCLGSSTRVVVTSGTFALGSPRYTSTAPSFTVAVPTTATSGKTETEIFNGVSYLITYTLSASASDTVSSFRRILISSRPTRNSNPDLGGFLKNAVGISSLPGTGQTTLSPIVVGGAEDYQVKNDDGTVNSQSEALTLSWFVTSGEMKYARTSGDSSNTFTASTSPQTTSLYLVGVLRDDRGGVDYEFLGP